MVTKSSERFAPAEQVPVVPVPSSATAPDGLQSARDLSRCYLVDVVKLLAAVALSPSSEAGLHSKVMAARAIMEIAGAVPQPVPLPPPAHQEVVGHGSGPTN